MQIRTIFENNEEIPEPYTCLGSNINPPFTFEDVPAETKTLVFIIEDMDATPRPWTHWLIFNIPASTKNVAEGQIPEGATEGLANNHTFGYEGPCPKYFNGVHHYRFSLFALDKTLDLPAATEKEAVKEAMQGHIIEEIALTGTCTSK